MCHSYCNTCNYCVSQCTCTQSTIVPPCTATTGCIDTNYGKCIYYSGTAITCGITASSGETMDAIVQKLATAICNVTPADLNWASFDYDCLGPYTTAQEFAEGVSAAICAINTAVDVTPNVTIPGACSGYFSGITPGTSSLLAILNDFIVKLCNLNSFDSTSSVNPSACWTSWTPVPTGSVDLGDWITWIQDNVCTITFNLDAEITALQTFQTNVESFIGTSSLPYTFNNTGACLGGGATDNLIQTINRIKTRLCSLYTTSLTPFSSNILYLPWSSYSCLWPGYLDSDTLANQGANIVDALAARTLNFSPDFTVTPSGTGCGFDVAFTVAPTPFTCSSLNTCSIKNLGDVDPTFVVSSQAAVLSWNGSAWTSKVLGLTSTGGSCSITTVVSPNFTFNVDFTLSPSTTLDNTILTPVQLAVGTPAGGVTPVEIKYNSNFFVGAGSTTGFTYAPASGSLAIANATLGPPSTLNTLQGILKNNEIRIEGQIDLVVTALAAGTQYPLGAFGYASTSVTTYWSSAYTLMDLTTPSSYPVFVGLNGNNLSIYTLAAVPAGTYTLSLSGLVFTA